MQTTERNAPDTGDKGLKQNAIGFLDTLVIGLASTAPAYSLAAVIGLVVVTAGAQAPAVLLASFVPMFFIAGAFYYMSRADQDCGTTFSWVTRAMGPWAGWMGGWAICVTGILVIGSLRLLAHSTIQRPGPLALRCRGTCYVFHSLQKVMEEI